MTFTKVLGGLCGSLLVFLLGAWVAEEMYHIGGKHGDEHQAYAIEVESDEVEVEVVKVSFDEAFAVADIDKGKKLWRQCSACHKQAEGANGTGPHLYNVVGRDKGSINGFGYSGVLASMEGDWTPENLNGFLESPKNYAPGTIMGYRGMAKIEDRASLIAYLQTNGE